MLTRRQFFIPAAALGSAALAIPRLSRAQASSTATPAPGDLRYYGAVADSDVTGALADAIASGYPVYIPAALGLCSVSASMPITRPVTIYGDGRGMSALKLAGDFSLLAVANNIQNCVFRDFAIVGQGGAVTQPAISYTNAPYNTISGMRIEYCGIGVGYYPGTIKPYSSFLNSILDSELLYNVQAGVLGESQTNCLRMLGVTLGGGGGLFGIKLLDSNNLCWLGGCCEGVTQSAAYLANQVASGAGCHRLSDINLGNSSALGDIVIGATGCPPVIATQIDTVSFAPNVGADSGLNVVNAYNVMLTGCAVLSGYYGSGLIQGWLRVGAASQGVSTNIASRSGAYSYTS